MFERLDARPGLKLLLTLLAIDLLVVLWALRGLQDSREHHERLTEATTQNLAQGLDFGLSASIEKIDLALLSAVDDLEEQLAARGRLDDARSNAMAQTFRARLGGDPGFRIADAQGIVMLGPDVVAGDRASWADRDFFAVQRERADAGLTVTPPLFGRVSKVWLISFARRYNHPDGRFAGVVSASLPVAYFQRLLGTADLGPGGVALLRDANLGLIARHPPLDVPSGQVGATTFSPELADIIASGRPSASFHAARTADGIERTSAYRRLKSAPMHLVVGMSAEHYLAGWRDEVRKTALQVLLLIGLTTLGGVLLWRSILQQRREAAHSQALLRSAGDGIHVVDTDGRIVEASDAFGRMLGANREQVVGTEIGRWLPSHRDAQGRQQLRERVLAGGHSVSENRYRRLDGSEFDAEVHAEGLVLGGQPLLFASARDITERKRSAAELAALNAELEQRVHDRTAALKEASARLAHARDAAEAANRAKSAFLANMSHELRTPLNAIIGMVGLLRRGALDATQAQRLAHIDTAAHHLLGLVGDVLDIARIEADKLVLEEAPLALPDLLSGVRDLVQHGADAKGLRLTVQRDGLPSQPLLGDATRLRQALLNYAVNAVKFTAAGTVHIGVRALAGEAGRTLLRFEVEDTGIGVEPDVAARLFHPFEQADSSTTRQFGGSGLGLAVTRRLAEAMGGDTGVESTPGLGSTFWFTAWLRHAAAAAPAAPAPAGGPAAAEAALRRDHAGRRVLVVEDEPVGRELVVMLLEEAGLQVETAGDGAQALERVATRLPDLILMDMQMPTMDGLEATRRIRALPGAAQLPIIAVTANAFGEDRARCLAAGMNDFLAKPVNAGALFETVLRWSRRAEPATAA